MTGSPRLALLTGTAGELGRFLAAHLAGNGWRVLGVDRVVPESGLDGVTDAQCDLRDGAATAQLLDRWFAEHGAPDLVVNAAGVIANSPLVALTPDGWQGHSPDLWNDVVNSTITAAFHVTTASVRHMLAARKQGLIVNISSVCAAGNPGQVAYSTAKAGLNGFTYALAKELGPVGIRVVGLAPGYLDTQSTRTNVTGSRLTKVTGAVPLKRLGSMSEFAASVDFLISNSYVNGTVLELDGGLVL